MTGRAKTWRSRRWWPARLRIRMALFVAAVLFGPVLLILWLGWSGYQRELRDAATRSQQLSTQIAEDRIGWTRSTRQLLVTFAQAEAVGRRDPDGCRALARALAEATPGIAGIAAFEPDGRRICAAQPSASEPDPVDEALFARVLETKTMVVGDPATSPVSGAKLLPFLYPVLADGSVVTVVITSIDLIWLSQALGAVASGLGASAGILNGSGVVVARWPGADTWIGKTTSSRIRLEAAATRSRLNPAFVAQTADGVEQILSVRPFPVFGDTVFYVAVGITMDEAREAAFATVSVGLATLTVVLALATTVGWFGADLAVLRPIGRVLAAMRRHAAGDIGARAGDGGGGELGELARAFDDLADSRSRAEANLRSAEAFLRGIVDNTIDGIVTINERGVVLTVNPAAERIFGYRAHEIVGNDVGMLMPEPHRGQHRGYIQRYLATGQGRIIGVGHRRLEALTKDGRSVPIDLGITEMIVDGRRTFIGVIRDVSDAVAADARLKASEERHRLVAEAMTDTVWQWDPIGDTSEWTGALETSFGYDPAAATSGLAFWIERVHPEDREAASSEVARLRETGGPSSTALEYRWRRAAGDYADVADRWTALRDENGRVSRVVIAMVDVTNTRTVERQLRQAQKMEAIGQLTGGIAHDFNNLLSIIIGNLDVLRDGSTVEKQPAMTATLVEEALNAALRGAELNRRLLAFARRQSLRPEVIEVGRALEGVADLLKRTLGERIRFETTVEPRTWPIEVDPSQLEAALVNLAVNARDAMPDGGNLTIEATNTTLDRDYADTHVETTPGDYVVISVADTGSGIPPDVLNRVFEPFFTTKEVGRGTGLGLSMVHGFVRQSGGHVTIYSEVGHGTVVRIYLPRVASAIAAGLASPSGEEAQGQGQNILVVEDNEALRGVVVRMLTSLGYRALEAGDAASALQVLAARSEIDLLFTDVVIPGALDGIALAKQARAERPGLKVLLTSGFTERTTVRGNGHVDNREPLPPLLGKPYRKADLATAVLAALSNGQG